MSTRYTNPPPTKRKNTHTSGDIHNTKRAKNGHGGEINDQPPPPPRPTKRKPGPGFATRRIARSRTDTRRPQAGSGSSGRHPVARVDHYSPPTSPRGNRHEPFQSPRGNRFEPSSFAEEYDHSPPIAREKLHNTGPPRIRPNFQREQTERLEDYIELDASVIGEYDGAFSQQGFSSRPASRRQSVARVNGYESSDDDIPAVVERDSRALATGLDVEEDEDLILLQLEGHVPSPNIPGPVEAPGVVKLAPEIEAPGKAEEPTQADIPPEPVPQQDSYIIPPPRTPTGPRRQMPHRLIAWPIQKKGPFSNRIVLRPQPQPTPSVSSFSSVTGTSPISVSTMFRSSPVFKSIHCLPKRQEPSVIEDDSYLVEEDSIVYPGPPQNETPSVEETPEIPDLAKARQELKQESEQVKRKHELGLRALQASMSRKQEEVEYEKRQLDTDTDFEDVEGRLRIEELKKEVEMLSGMISDYMAQSSREEAAIREKQRDLSLQEYKQKQKKVETEKEKGLELSPQDIMDLEAEPEHHTARQSHSKDIRERAFRKSEWKQETPLKDVPKDYAMVRQKEIKERELLAKKWKEEQAKKEELKNLQKQRELELRDEAAAKQKALQEKLQKEQERRVLELQEREARKNELKERDMREREAQARKWKEAEAQKREQREKEARDRIARQKALKETEEREREQKEREMKEWARQSEQRTLADKERSLMPPPPAPMQPVDSLFSRNGMASSKVTPVPAPSNGVTPVRAPVGSGFGHGKDARGTGVMPSGMVNPVQGGQGGSQMPVGYPGQQPGQYPIGHVMPRPNLYEPVRKGSFRGPRGPRKKTIDQTPTQSPTEPTPPASQFSFLAPPAAPRFNVQKAPPPVLTYAPPMSSTEPQELSLAQQQQKSRQEQQMAKARLAAGLVQVPTLLSNGSVKTPEMTSSWKIPPITLSTDQKRSCWVLKNLPIRVTNDIHLNSVKLPTSTPRPKWRKRAFCGAQVELSLSRKVQPDRVSPPVISSKEQFCMIVPRSLQDRSKWTTIPAQVWQ